MESIVKRSQKFAKKFHSKDLRLSGETVYEHTLRVFHTLEDSGVVDERILSASILHHALDKSDALVDELSSTFSSEIAQLTRDFKRLTTLHVKLPESSNKFHDQIVLTFLNYAANLDVLTIRFADKTDNVKTSLVFPKDERIRISTRALEIYAPMCRLLGLTKFVTELEDNAFKILQPRSYHEIDKYLLWVTPYVQAFLDEATEVIRDLLIERGITPVLSSRIKSIYSIHKKNLYTQRKGVELQQDFSHLFDVAALRIIVDAIEDCYLAGSIIEALFDTIPIHTADYITHPKPNGYQSIHYVFNATTKFKAEVQIRTHQMHDASTFGISSHVFYKTGADLKRKLLEDPAWLKKINYWQHDEYVTAYGDIKHKNVYVFTPKGDIIVLPKNATSVDFAYAIHDDVGNSCVGCKINGVIEKLNTPLDNGDTVEILTRSNKTMPSKDWLLFVKTSRARTSIKKKLK